MKHIMIDLETLSSNSDAAIIQIGAIAFSANRGLLDGEGFRVTVDFEDAMKYGSISGSTLKWWMDQDNAARASVTGGTVKLHEALGFLNNYIGKFPGDLQFWAHATFDFPILQNAYSKVGLRSALPYKKMRDLRTLEEVAGEFITWDKRQGIAHDALDDAKFQALHAIKMLQEIDTMQQRRRDQ